MQIARVTRSARSLETRMADATPYTDAFIYSFPIYEMARTRHLAMSHPLSPL